MTNIKELNRVIAFLEANGWKYSERESNDEYDSFIKDDAIGIDVGTDRITFIGETGDFAYIPLNYYHLLGYMYHHRLLHPVIPEFNDA